MRIVWGMRMTVVGTGYLGATHAACMAELGHDVLGVDTDPAKVERLNAGKSPFYEPGLKKLLKRGVSAGKLRFTTDPAEAAEFAKTHFLCVGTPQQAGGAGADLSQIYAVVDALAPLLRGDHVLLGKSTVPVGTTPVLQERMDRLIQGAAANAATKKEDSKKGSKGKKNAAPAARCTVAWNPEFLRESTAVDDTLHPDRIVVGARDEDREEIEKLVREIYAEPLAEGSPLMMMDPATAELVKTSANSFLATKISFINAVADLCDASGGDVTALAAALGADRRIGKSFLHAGLGFGGGCLPKDVRAFMTTAEELGATGASGLLSQVDAINNSRRDKVEHMAHEVFGGDVTGRSITVLGAAFKPRSDDVREAPGVDIAMRLYQAGAHVRIYDPKAKKTARLAAPELQHAPTLPEALQGAELVIVPTEWPKFRRLKPAEALDAVQAGPAPGAGVAPGEKKKKKAPTVIDGRNCLDQQAWEDAGWRVLALGRSRTLD